MEGKGIDPGLMPGAGRQALAALHVINGGLGSRAGHRQLFPVGAELQGENLSRLPFEGADQGAFPAGEDLVGSIHPIVIGDSFFAANHYPVPTGMASHGCQFLLQRVEVLDEGP